MSDKRQHQRYRLNQPVTVYHKDTGRIIGRVLDITPGGMMIMGATSFKKKQHVPFNLVFPSSVENHTSINIDGICVWCEHSTYSDDFVSGYKFQGTSETSTNIINQLNKTFSDGIPKPETP